MTKLTNIYANRQDRMCQTVSLAATWLTASTLKTSAANTENIPGNKDFLYFYSRNCEPTDGKIHKPA